MRTVSAIIQAELGRKGMRQFPVKRIAAYTVDTGMDTDTDPFSIDIRMKPQDVSVLLQRDTEVRVNLFTNAGAKVEQLHSGITDRITFDSDDRMLSITGRDFSCIATDTDAAPGKWKHVQPAAFIAQRANALGISNVKIAKCSELNTVVTDGSEREWAFWYRLMREKNMWLWFEPNGRMVGDKLAYDIAPSYYFGDPSPRGHRMHKGWLPVERLAVTKSDQGRIGEVWIYAEDPKTNRTYFGRGIDTTIRSWKRKPVKIITSTTAKSAKEVKKQADDEVFESIVGSTEITLTVRDPGFIIRQNTMAQVNIPELDFSGMWFIVGVRIRGGAEGFYQEVRLRERGFALSKRVPDPPKLRTDMNDPAENAVPSSIAAALASSGVKYAGAFQQATQEFRGGWDFAVFLGVLMSIASKESPGFKNVRQKHPNSTANGVEWFPMPTEAARANVNIPTNPVTGQPILSGSTVAEAQDDWRRAFANGAGNPFNPFGGDEAGVGLMQLTTLGYKQWADEYGWNGVPKAGEYDGGRWNPESNIRAGARALAGKLAVVHADPNNPDDVWRGVQAYNGSGPAAEAYRRAVKAIFDSQYGPVAVGAVSAATSLAAGTKVNVTVGGHTFKFPKEMPDTIKKAINFAFRHLGDPYRWGGPSGSNDKLANGRLLYDCSSLVAAALYAGGVRTVSQPRLGYHGDATYGLVKKGVAVSKDNLLPGDMVFFERSLGHMGMYLDDGLFIHDPHTGDVVKISSLNSGWYREQFNTARRLVAWPGVGVGHAN
jgi:cell wall-associated NlpC family hydrolase/prophage tail gpP-like protein